MSELRPHTTLSKGFLIAAGLICVAFGSLGIFLPVLPTTPFLLLAAWCFARSSDRYYNWLISNRIFGQYIRNYQEGRGLPLRIKILAIVMLWTAILYSIYAWVSHTVLQLALLTIAVGVTIYIISIKPTTPPEIEVVS